jgi:hypothetical protein
MAYHGFLAGNSLRTKLPIAAGSCSPAPPTKVYERSKPAGPSTLMSQLSSARDPTIDTRHAPGLSLSTCSMIATISPRARGSPVFCISILTAMSLYCTKRPSNPVSWKTVKGPWRAELNSRLTVGWLSIGRQRRAFQRLSKNESDDCGPPADHLVKWCFTIPDGKGRTGENAFSWRPGVWQ